MAKKKVETPEVKTSEVKTSEVKTLEVKTPEVKTLEVETLEVKTPEVETLEVKTPEVETKTAECILIGIEESKGYLENAVEINPILFLQNTKFTPTREILIKKGWEKSEVLKLTDEQIRTAFVFNLL